ELPKLRVEGSSPFARLLKAVAGPSSGFRRTQVKLGQMTVDFRVSQEHDRGQAPAGRVVAVVRVRGEGLWLYRALRSRKSREARVSMSLRSSRPSLLRRRSPPDTRSMQRFSSR